MPRKNIISKITVYPVLVKTPTRIRKKKVSRAVKL